jgi:hypothetical protein
MSGLDLTTTVPVNAYYDVEIITEEPTVLFKNLNLTNTTNILNFTNINESIAAPSGKRVVEEFELNTDLTNYNNVTINYNYTKLEKALDNENNLVMYKCNSVSSCSWTLLTSTLNTTTNIISTTQTSLSVFLIAETAETTTTITRTLSSAGGGGGGGGAISTKEILRYINLELISPSPLSMYSNDTIITPVILRNSGDVTLKNISLYAESNTSDLSLNLTKSSFDILYVNDKKETSLLIKSHTKPGRYEITITADVQKPIFSDSVKLYIDLVEKGALNRTIIEERIIFAKDLFKENPECLDLQELLSQAEIALKNNEFEKAASLTEAAINGCKDLITSMVRYKPEKFTTKITMRYYIIPLIFVFILFLLYLNFKKSTYKIKKRARVRKEKTRKAFFSLFKMKKKKIKQKKVSEREEDELWRRKRL